MQYRNHPKRKKKIDEKLFAALAKHGNIRTACAEVGIGRSTFYEWQKDDSEFATRSETEIILGKQQVNDFAQAKLIQLVEQGNFNAITYHLSRRHPDYRLPKIESNRMTMLWEKNRSKTLSAYEFPDPEDLE